MIEGRVTAVSADALLDPVTRSFYYFVEVVLSQDELRKLGHELIPGMPVEAFLATDGRSPASYAVKPIADYFARAFRD
jgi:HlyD family secretion protein